jgi:hypothetical protein
MVKETFVRLTSSNLEAGFFLSLSLHRSHLEHMECPCLKYHDITTSHNVQLVAVFKSSLSQKVTI